CVGMNNAAIAPRQRRIQGFFNRFNPNGLAQSQVLHRLAILEIPGIVRQQGSTLTLAGNGEERWKLTRPLSQH
ncbi:hypothetical protein ACUOA8_61820, partial [Escherichia sp. SS-MK2]